MKKNVMCITLATALLAMAIPAFATNSTYSKSYSSSYSDDYFNTSGSISKADTEAWVKIQDRATYTRYYDIDTGAMTDDAGTHITYLISSSGRTVSGAQRGKGGCTLTFTGSAIEGARIEKTIRLQIQIAHDGTTSRYMKTAGSMYGEAKQGIEVDTVSPDLDAK